MHPVNNRFFGNAVGQLQIYYDNGISSVGGYIVSQIGTSRYVVSTAGVTNTVLLAQDTFTANSVANVTNAATVGYGTILITPPTGTGTTGLTVEHVAKLMENQVVTTEGNVYPWNVLAASGDAYYASMAQEEVLAAAVVVNLAVTFAHNTTNSISMASSITGTYTKLAVASQPVHGLSATGYASNAAIVYVGNTTYTGADTFTFDVVNGVGDNAVTSNIGTVTVTLT